MWKFNNDKPVYIQIIDEIMMRIVSGEYKAGQRIPSVRELSEEARVNPNTMQKALSEIENMGYIISLRTSGIYVTDDITLINSFRDNRAEEIIKNFINDIEKIGLSTNDAVRMLKDYSENT
jgi:DNA-binding transcriptional regulator YhcF (GntR family)